MVKVSQNIYQFATPHTVGALTTTIKRIWDNGRSDFTKIIIIDGNHMYDSVTFTDYNESVIPTVRITSNIGKWLSDHKHSLTNAIIIIDGHKRNTQIHQQLHDYTYSTGVGFIRSHLLSRNNKLLLVD